ncbi:MAG: hypothetical protein NTW19_23615 [Planctomycetota bacterium]|nr:hypothetical protein [Planctomycetota bacterium]
MSLASASLATFSDAKPAKPLRLLFIHHSCGGQLLAPVGADVDPGQNCVYESHSNGGGLKAALATSGFAVHEASYGSAVGEKTDLFDWLPKFRGQMDDVLRVDLQDKQLPDSKTNQVVMFKSCYPNSQFVGEGAAPGNPAGPELTVWNAKATFAAMLPEFAKRPEVLFVYVTAPPIAPRVHSIRFYKKLVRQIRGQPLPQTAEERAREGALARQFNNWVASKDGWLKDYPHKNVAVFDYYDELTDAGKSDLLAYPTRDGYDSHPSQAGNERAAKVFLPFIHRAVRRAGLSE